MCNVETNVINADASAGVQNAIYVEPITAQQIGHILSAESVQKRRRRRRIDSRLLLLIMSTIGYRGRRRRRRGRRRLRNGRRRRLLQIGYNVTITENVVNAVRRWNEKIISYTPLKISCYENDIRSFTFSFVLWTKNRKNFFIRTKF